VKLKIFLISHKNIWDVFSLYVALVIREKFSKHKEKLNAEVKAEYKRKEKFRKTERLSENLCIILSVYRTNGTLDGSNK